jgi:membrane protein
VRTGDRDVPDAGRKRMRSAVTGLQTRAAGSAVRASERYTRTRERMDQTAAGHLHRSIVHIDLVHQALILAALALMSLIPMLISISGLLPAGVPSSAAANLAHRWGISGEAAEDLKQLFPSHQAVRNSTTWFSAILSLLSAFTWPAALQKGYQLTWGTPPPGWRALWRPLVWLISFVGFAGALTVLGGLVHGWPGAVLTVLVGLPAVVAWVWWTQHLMLCGRVGWRALLPGAIATTVGLLGLRFGAALLLSPAITSNYRDYGTLGIVFVLLSWLVAFSVVMLGGAVVGFTLHEHPIHLRAIRLRRVRPRLLRRP